jgi:ribosomal protein S18 acetylase RimI-like enzyme
VRGLLTRDTPSERSTFTDERWHAMAAALQELVGCDRLHPSSNVGAVATYKSAGFQQLPEIRDQYRDA